jgi:dihydroorotate dehydrogenase electron transfer subunit
MNIPKTTKILDIRNEAENVKTITFKYPNKSKPGQFFMIWIPGVDEIPMSVSYLDKGIKGITFKKIGDATSALYKLKKGECIGVRGPYGNGFQLKGKQVLFVGGGTGIATIAPAVEHTVKNKNEATVIIGAKTKDELFFEDRLKKCGAKILVSTDDGSKGFKGFATDLAQDILKKENIDSIMTCGPEQMMKTLLTYSNNIFFQASLERYMKCALGLCGQCCIGEGLRVCMDGPIFDGKTLKNVTDFGEFRRDSAGRKVRF